MSCEKGELTMAKTSRSICLAMAAAMTALVLPQAASSAPVYSGAPAAPVAQNENIIEVNRHRDRDRERRGWRRDRDGRWIVPGIIGGLIIGSQLNRGYYYNDYPRYAPRRYTRSYNRHVNWCLDRYRSYNPATDRFLSYSGNYVRCNSPYR
jgi:hypothetical protein